MEESKILEADPLIVKLDSSKTELVHQPHFSKILYKGGMHMFFYQ